VTPASGGSGRRRGVGERGEREREKKLGEGERGRSSAFYRAREGEERTPGERNDQLSTPSMAATVNDAIRENVGRERERVVRRFPALRGAVGRARTPRDAGRARRARAPSGGGMRRKRRGGPRVGPTCHREKEGRGWAAGRLAPNGPNSARVRVFRICFFLFFSIKKYK
jgi:hypothetical protein